MYYFDNQKHQFPHIHVSYQDDEVVLAIPSGDILEGKLQKSKLKLIQAWVEIHQKVSQVRRKFDGIVVLLFSKFIHSSIPSRLMFLK